MNPSSDEDKPEEMKQEMPLVDSDKGAARVETTTKKTSSAGATAVAAVTGSQKISTPPLSKLFSLARPEAPFLVLALALMLLGEVGTLIIPLILAKAYNVLINIQLTKREIHDQINLTMIRVLCIHAAASACFFLRQVILQTAGERVVARLRNRLYACILKQELAFFDENRTGELVSRLGSDTTLMQQATTNAVPEALVGVIKVVVSMGLMIWISAPLAGVTMAFVLITFVVCLPFGTAIGRLTKKYQDTLGQAQTYSTEALGAMRTVQSFGAEDKELQRFRDKIGDPQTDSMMWPLWYPKRSKDYVTTYSVGYFRAVAHSAFVVTLVGVGFGSLFCSLWYGLVLVSDGELSLGNFAAFQTYIFAIGGGLAQTAVVMSQVLEAQGASTSIFQLLERVPAIPQRRPPSTTNHAKESSSASPADNHGNISNVKNERLPERTDALHENDEESPQLPPPPFFESTLKPACVAGNVEFNGVSFSYRGDVSVLNNFSLKIRAGESVALVGSSGAGKSTVVALLQRFYDVTDGSILLDGNDIRSLDVRWLRQQMGYVQQEPQLFGLTIRENICYGILENTSSITDEQVYDACRRANAHDFIQKWPKGYNTMVGERGITLSGGQKQRLAIARALIINPRILILDEATSALDAESEHLVQEAIDQAVQGRTVFIVAHRLSTIQRADQIVVMDDHRIVDVGTHSDLMGRCTKYKDLIKRQQVMAEERAKQRSKEFLALEASRPVPRKTRSLIFSPTGLFSFEA